MLEFALIRESLTWRRRGASVRLRHDASLKVAMLRVARLASFKYPDLPRYFFPAAVIADDPGCVMLFHPIGTPIWGGKQRAVHRLDMHNLHLLYPDRDYNVVLLWDRDWTFLYYYINIALPMAWDGELCHVVDLEIDIAAWTQESRDVQAKQRRAGIEILDEDEFAHRAHVYSAELIQRVAAARRDVIALLEAEAYPFDGSLIHWRPSSEVDALTGWPDQSALWHVR